ncbi:phage tail sheath family protein [Paenibacillus provencensis]|uniref:Phage tail sheath family protein n=1 Tax=Paenibacillus provencensis TaxID=441151 RepID=A0ABW3Q212_9BACL|nr:phage tail sheath family protein [Paenibacillus sp. MER 78]MCM3129015.1 phage tail sheath family protein [Paenibacillus sp. MER 78]
MSLNHGVRAKETFSQGKTRVEQTNTLPVYFGTAPIHLITDPESAVNKVILATNLDDFKRKFGYSEDWASFTLCEAAYAHFVENEQSPIAFVNVLDPSTDKEAVSAAAVSLFEGMYIIERSGVLKSSVTVSSEDGSTSYVLNQDYTLTFNDEGYLVLSIIAGGSIAGNSVQLGYDVLDPSLITASRIIGGTDIETGERTGLELIEEVFLSTYLVPNLIVAPGFSDQPEIAAIMEAKAESINGLFEAYAVTDLDASQKYMSIAQWKEDNDYNGYLQINTYPMIKNGDRMYHLSTHVTATMLATDSQNNGVPYQSPSNQAMTGDAMVYKDGSPARIPYDQANVLNANGIVTALNWQGQFNVWGNYTGAYPSYEDAQRTFIPVRRMFSYVKNNLVLRHWRKVDNPLSRRLIESNVDDTNIWINGLVASGYLLGGRVEFNASDNPTEQLESGKTVYRIFITPPGPAQEIEYIAAYDASYLASLTAA